MDLEHIAIEQATSSDMSDIQYLFRKMFEIYHVDQNIEYPYTEDGINYLKNCIQHQIALIAKHNDTTIGFVTGEIENALPFKSYHQQGHIHNLYVMDEYRNRGIGKGLVLLFIQKCHEKDVHRIVADSDDQESLRRFYLSLGFHVSGINYDMDSRK